MCGRFAQTIDVVNTAVREFNAKRHEDYLKQDVEEMDQYNISPGMELSVIVCNDSEKNDFKEDRQYWGILPKGGSEQKPLDPGRSKHFAAQCYNARSETIEDKITFAPLVTQHKSCIVPVDGWYEWKTELKRGPKQPYYIYKNISTDAKSTGSLSYLIGLWDTTTTFSNPDYIKCFTLLTTSSSADLQWLHSRMPIASPTIDLAREWLCSPSIALIKRLRGIVDVPKMLIYHRVQDKMTNINFNKPECIIPMTVTTIRDCFTVNKNEKNEVDNESNCIKDDTSQLPSSSTQTIKRAKLEALPDSKSQLRQSTLISFFK